MPQSKTADPNGMTGANKELDIVSLKIYVS